MSEREIYRGGSWRGRHERRGLRQCSSLCACAKDPKKTWDESYDVAVLRGMPAFVVGGKYLLNAQALDSVGAMTEASKELLVK